MHTKTLFAIAGLAAAITPATLHAQDDANRTRQDRQRDATRQLERQQDSSRNDSSYGSPNEATRALGELQDLTGLWKITVTKYGPDGKAMSSEKSDQNRQAVRRSAGNSDSATRDRDEMRERDTADRDSRDQETRDRTDRDNDRADRDTDRNSNDRANRDASDRETQRDANRSNNRNNSGANSGNDAYASGSMQSTGIADRRWTLDGTLLVERYTYGGSTGGALSDLPLQTMATSEGEGVERMRSNRGASNADRDSVDNNRRKHPNADPNRVPGLVDDMSANPSRTSGDDSDSDREREARRALRDAREQDGNAENAWGTNNQARKHADKASHGARQGMVLWGYDKSSDEVSVVWADDTGGSVKMDKGKLGSNKKLELTGSASDENGESFKTRTVIDLSETNKQTLVMYRTDGTSGKEYKALEIVYNKISSASDAVTLAD